MNGGVLFILDDDDDCKLSVVQIANDRLSSTTSAEFERNFFPSLTLYLFFQLVMIKNEKESCEMPRK